MVVIGRGVAGSRIPDFVVPETGGAGVAHVLRRFVIVVVIIISEAVVRFNGVRHPRIPCDAGTDPVALQREDRAVAADIVDLLRVTAGLVALRLHNDRRICVMRTVIDHDDVARDRDLQILTTNSDRLIRAANARPGSRPDRRIYQVGIRARGYRTLMVRRCVEGVRGCVKAGAVLVVKRGLNRVLINQVLNHFRIGQRSIIDAQILEVALDVAVRPARNADVVIVPAGNGIQECRNIRLLLGEV